MADTKDVPKDPIVDRSIAGWFLVFSGLLVIATAWTIVDEAIIRRPWKAHQADFIELATTKASVDEKHFAALVAEERESDAYLDAEEALTEAREERAALQEEVTTLTARKRALEGELSTIRGDYQKLRGAYQPLVYNHEQAKLGGDTATAEKELEAIQEAEGPIKEVFDKFVGLTQEKADIQARLQEIEAPVTAAIKAVSAALPSRALLDRALLAQGKKPSGAGKGADDPPGLSDTWITEIKQIYNPELDVADRCQSCHVNAAELGFSEADWDRAGQKLGEEQLAHAKRVFDSHPNLGNDDPGAFDSFAAHPVGVFGCTTCHFGNGPGTVEDKAHGLQGPPREAWLEPRHYELKPMLPTDSAHLGSMFEASCVKCHDQQQYVQGAEQLSRGRELLEDVGCVGCHKIKGFRVWETEQQDIENDLDKNLRPELRSLNEALATGEDKNTVKKKIIAVGSKIDAAERRLGQLDKEIKFIGPDLNRTGLAGLKSKIYKKWLPRWIANPHEYRPGTRMPNSLLARNEDPMKDEVTQVAAYIWQQAGGTAVNADGPTQTFSDADVKEGAWLIRTVGCTACHGLEHNGGRDEIEALRPAELDATATSWEVYDMKSFWASEDAKLATKDGAEKPERTPLIKRGANFGPNLGRIGDKIRYDWLVAWLKDPKALQPHTSMPSLRLSDDEARKIAAYLTNDTKSSGPGGETFKDFDTTLLDDPNLASLGLRHIERYGCYNCHAIDLKAPPISEAKMLAGTAQPPMSEWKPKAQGGKIGIELSAHGSKPLPQFDFGLHHHDLPEFRPAWIVTKLLEPRYFDTDKYKGDPKDRSIMPRFGLTGDEAAAITTAVVGLVEDKVPGQYLFRPGRRGQAVAQGERILKKYNCRSCHLVDGRGGWGHEALFTGIDEAVSNDELTTQKLGGAALETTDYRPPALTAQGVRAKPEWAYHFLKNPGSVETDGKIRPFHLVRMPTFELSDDETQALVDYFNALEDRLAPYAGEVAKASQAQLNLGREKYAENQCYQCHSVGTWRSSEYVGPNFQITRERNREEWLLQFLSDPASYVPGTKMLPFWGGEPFHSQSADDQEQIRAVAAYVLALGDPAFRRAEGFEKGKTPKVVDIFKRQQEEKKRKRGD